MFILLFGRILQVLLTVAQLKLATSILSPSEYGSWSLIQTMATFFILLGISPLGFYLNRNVVDWYTRGFFRSVFRSYLLYMLFFSLFMSGLVFFAARAELVEIPYLLPSHLALLVGFLIISQTFHQTWIPTLNFLGNRKCFVFGSLASILINIVVASSLLAFGLEGVKWWSLSVSLGFILSALLFIPKDWWLKGDKPWKEYVSVKEMFFFATPLLFTSVFIWFQTQGYRFVVSPKMGIDELGKYVAGYAVVAGLYTSVEAVLSNYFQALFFKKISMKHNYPQELEKVWKISLFPIVLSGVLLFFTAPDLAKLFLGDKFTEETSWMAFLALAEGTRVAFNTISVNFHGKKETSKLVLPQIFGLLTALGLLSIFNNLSFLTIIGAITTGNVVAIFFLYCLDWKTFHRSFFHLHLLKSLFSGTLFVLLCIFVSSFLENFLKITIIVLLALLFSVPYIKEYFFKEDL